MVRGLVLEIDHGLGREQLFNDLHMPCPRRLHKGRHATHIAHIDIGSRSTELFPSTPPRHMHLRDIPSRP